jgi:hypothetical protein
MKKIIALVALFSAMLVGVAQAAPAVPEGEIAVADGSNLVYGGSVSFDTTVTGKVQKQAEIYVSVVCWQGEPPVTVVYQWSSHVNSFVFPLFDQGGQGLEWNGGAADCAAQLIYRLDNGPRGSSTIIALDTIYFGVTA